MPRKLILSSFLSPGDVCTLTAAIESLHQTYPGEYLTDVRTSCDELFLGNPHITKLRDDEAEVLQMHYTDLISCADTVPNPFIRGYCHNLGKQLGVPLELTTNRPHIYLTADDQGDHPLARLGETTPVRYWLVTAGVKPDFTLKQWPVEYYQAVINHFQDRIQFVQVGSTEHDHPVLDGATNLLGQTDLRQLIQLVYHADGGLGPITLLQHLFAAFEKPYVALLGGREPTTWAQYPLQTTFHTLGKLPCCLRHACWRSRVVRLNDDSEQNQNLCELPILGMSRPVGKCMAMIQPGDVIRAIENYLSDAPSMLSPVPSSGTKPEKVVSRPEPGEQTPEFIAYSEWGFDTQIVPAWTARDWMDATGEKFAYHCLPMVLANQSGWMILAPHGVIAEWNGGQAPGDMNVEIIGAPKAIQAQSQVGSGILTWTIPFVFRTPPGWNLLCRGPANYLKDGLCPLEGLVETDWSFASFSMNWKFTRPGRCEFREGEPIAMLVPHKRFDLEQFTTRFATLKQNPQLREGYDLWIRSRHEFWAAQKSGDPKVLKQKFQKHYFRGCTTQGVFFQDHQKARKLAPFIEAKPVVEQNAQPPRLAP